MTPKNRQMLSAALSTSMTPEMAGELLGLNEQASLPQIAAAVGKSLRLINTQELRTYEGSIVEAMLLVVDVARDVLMAANHPKQTSNVCS